MRKSFKILALVGAGLLAWSAYGLRHDLETTYQPIQTNLSRNYTIAHLSDIHNQHPLGLIRELKRQKPDYIMITGDLISDFATDGNQKAVNIVRDCVKISPTYVITGNHEWYLPQDEFEDFSLKIKQAGAVWVDLSTVYLTKELTVTGAYDPFDTLPKTPDAKFNMLLSHRPERFYEYIQTDFDLVLAGHAHGGQIRLPFTQGLFAPGQGILPKYTAGLHKKNNTSMIVSRGLGNDVNIPKFYNRPEVVIIKLLAESRKG